MFRKAWQFLGSVVSGSTPDEDPVPSLVLLLETPFDLTKESALRLAVEAWGESAEEPTLVRSPRRGSYVIRVSNLLFSLHAERVRYEAPGREPNAVRQRVWDHHRAWLSIEYPEGPKTPESQWPACYKLLFLLANQLWDDNCLGIYLPREGVTVPNMGDLISSIRWAGNNGTPLPFLHEASERGA